MLHIRDLHFSVDGLQILESLSCDIKEGSITGLIGPNGAGKSTVFNVITGLIPEAKGSIRIRGTEILGIDPHEISRLGISRTFQDSLALKQISMLENLMSFSPLLRDFSLVKLFLSPRAAARLTAEAKSKAESMLRTVGLQDKAHHLAKDLSYGQTKLLEILKVIISDAELILLDEPFSGLYPEMVKVITKLIYDLKDRGKTIVFVEHNMKLIEEICDHVIVLDSGEKIAEGTFAQIRRDKKVIEAYLGD